MDKKQLQSYLARIDAGLRNNATLYVYGSSALILLDEEDRSSLDMDVAAPYSQADFEDLRQAADKAGLPVNPEEDTRSDHIEWISPARLCLSPPTPETDLLLWQGTKLTVKTASPAKLVASKLIRYDSIDQADIRYLCVRMRPALSDIEAAVRRLPPPFRHDPVVLENLENLKTDMTMWTEDSANDTA